jgi:hypothetical protein|nr:MAG TPA: Protein of unknown function (DUF2570) [Caudoviricetes sp.]
MVFKMIRLYVILSYVVIGFLGFIGLRHIGTLNDTIKSQKLEIETAKEAQKVVIEAYDQEIKDLTESAKERKVVVKEIIKTVKGTKDEECLNRHIPTIIIDKLHKQSSDKK